MKPTVETVKLTVIRGRIKSMSERKLIRTYYRSLTPDGRLWCESRDPEEVKRMSEGKDCTFDKYEVYEVTEGWEPWGN